MKEDLIAALNDIALSLTTTGKQDTAKYFLSIKDKILTVSDNNKLKKILTQLMSSGSITQYANFSYNEEVLFDRVYEAAKQYLTKL